MSVERLVLAFRADDAVDAQRQAREWAAAEPSLRLRTVASIRKRTEPDGHWLGWWDVTVAVSRDEAMPPLSEAELWRGYAGADDA
jgi:hypothetical protein